MGLGGGGFQENLILRVNFYKKLFAINVLHQEDYLNFSRNLYTMFKIIGSGGIQAATEGAVEKRIR